MSNPSLREYLGGYFDRLQALIAEMPLDTVEEIGETLFQAYRHNKQVFVMGNGGSAATASHMACDIGKNTIGANAPRFRVLSLNDNMALLSALANDIGYDRVFSEQLVNLIRPGDVLIAISASGRSPNIVAAMRYARERAATTIALVGFGGGEAIELADQYVLVPSSDYGLVEDMHMILNHAITGYFKERLEQQRPVTA